MDPFSFGYLIWKRCHRSGHVMGFLNGIYNVIGHIEERGNCRNAGPGKNFRGEGEHEEGQGPGRSEPGGHGMERGGWAGGRDRGREERAGGGGMGARGHGHMHWAGWNRGQELAGKWDSNERVVQKRPHHGDFVVGTKTLLRISIFRDITVTRYLHSEHW